MSPLRQKRKEEESVREMREGVRVNVAGGAQGQSQKNKMLAEARSKVLQLTASKENRDPSRTTTRNLISEQPE